MSSSRNILFFVTIGASVLLPFGVYQAQQAQSRYIGLQSAMNQLQAEQRELTRLEQHLARYEDYAKTVESFVAAAELYGIGASNFDSHMVDIKDMFLPYDDLAGFVGDMKTGPGSYFIPERLVLRTQPTVTREDIPSGSNARPEPGGLTLSVKGRFLVER